MTIELKMNTNVRRGVRFIIDDDVNPIIDLDNIRYFLDVETYLIWGKLVWTRFDMNTMLPLDDHSFVRQYASHNVFGELLLGTNWSTVPLQQDSFPAFPVPNDNGSVIP